MIDENKLAQMKQRPLSVWNPEMFYEWIETTEILWRIARAAQAYIKLPEGEDDKEIIALDNALLALPGEENK